MEDLYEYGKATPIQVSEGRIANSIWFKRRGLVRISVQISGRDVFSKSSNF